MITFDHNFTDKGDGTRLITTKPDLDEIKILVIPASWTKNKRFKSLGNGLVWISLDEYQQDIK